MEKVDVIVNGLTEWLGFHKTREFIERNPRFPSHEVRDILEKVFEYAEELKDEEYKGIREDGRDDGYSMGLIDGEKEAEEKECKWEYDEGIDAFDTDCENTHQFNEGTIEENQYQFCPYCRGKIVEVKK